MDFYDKISLSLNFQRVFKKNVIKDKVVQKENKNLKVYAVFFSVSVQVS